MFDKLNIIINNEPQIKESKNLIVEIFSNKYEIAIITCIIYFIGVLYQIFKLIDFLSFEPKMGYLMFFSFSNSLNDFLIIFGFAFYIFLITFFIIFAPSYAFNIYSIKQKYSKIVYFIWFLIILLSLIFLYFFTVNGNIDFLIFFILPYLFSCIITYIIFTKKISKLHIYMSIFFFIILSFGVMLYDEVKYYGCEKLKGNTMDDCILINYKNDKYGFTGSGDVYNLSEFKSFYTHDYFKSLNNSRELETQ